MTEDDVRVTLGKENLAVKTKKREEIMEDALCDVKTSTKKYFVKLFILLFVL